MATAGRRRFVAFTQEDKHFVAVRWLDGDLEINFHNRTHSWQRAVILHDPHRQHAYENVKGVWVINTAVVHQLFEVVPLDLDRKLDCPAVTSDRCDADACGGTDDAAILLLRIDSIEHLCMDYACVLASKPDMWFQVPFPFATVCQQSWNRDLENFHLDLLSDVGIEVCRVDSAAVSRVAKRVRCFMFLLRHYCRNIHAVPSSFHIMPNPCAYKVPKRSWEQSMCWHRQNARGVVQGCANLTESDKDVQFVDAVPRQGEDVQGGSSQPHALDRELERGAAEKNDSEHIQQLQNIHHNRQVARMIRDGQSKLKMVRGNLEHQGADLSALGLKHMLPQLFHIGFVQRCILPVPPSQWHEVIDFPITIDHLKILHGHERDRRLTFEAKSHTYFWDGVATDGSVTGLIHRFVTPFDSDTVIAAMRRSTHWPRPGYIKPYIHEETLCEFKSRPWAADLVELLCKTRKSEETICDMVADLLQKHPEEVELLLSVAMSDAVIKKKWADNSLEAAQRGTWMHLEFETLLAGNARCLAKSVFCKSFY